MKTSKAVCLVLLLVASMTSISFAQIRFALGFRTGLNFSTISYAQDPFQGPGITKSGTTNFAAGAVVELGFGKMFAAEVEPRFIQKGVRFEQTVQGQTATPRATSTGSELEIPIHFKVKFIEGPVRPYAIIGPNIGIVLSAKTKFENTQNDGEVDTKANTSSTDFGLDFGGGAEFKVASNIALTGDIRYSLGLSNLDATPGSTNSAKARGFQVLAGVLFIL